MCVHACVHECMRVYATHRAGLVLREGGGGGSVLREEGGESGTRGVGVGGGEPGLTGTQAREAARACG